MDERGVDQFIFNVLPTTVINDKETQVIIGLLKRILSRRVLIDKLFFFFSSSFMSPDSRVPLETVN